jgi:diaminopimelate epimerase
MTLIPFFKMSGAGNDFIIIDNRQGIVPEEILPDFITRTCKRRLSTGADGLILLEDSERADFKWRFFNADGSVAEMCGNGARCIARFAALNGITGNESTFETLAGLMHARVVDGRVSLKMTDPVDLRLEYPLELEGDALTVSSLNTGVPHVVVSVPELTQLDVVSLGRQIRHHSLYAPAGTNANFICPVDSDTIAVRTYERGVEDETLACGTGAVAAALITAKTKARPSPIKVLTRSGSELKIHFESQNDLFRNVYMEGDARVVYTGEMSEEAWQY